MRIVRAVISIVLIVMLVGMTGCAAHTHKVGAGATGTQVEQQRQWYVLFGLVPINTVDTDVMAAGAADYDIETKQSFLDVVLNIFTGIVTVNSRTVKVKK